MDDQLYTLLETLSGQLGVTVEYLWSILLKQAAVSALAHMATLIITLIIVAILLYFYIPFVRSLTSEHDPGPASVIFVIVVGAMVLIIGISALIGIVEIPLEVIVPLINPEYYALEHILSNVR